MKEPMRALFRLALAAALWAPSLGSVSHSLQTARAEAAHPLWAEAESDGSLRTSRSHHHHDENDCSQCPRPAQASLGTAPAFGAWFRPLSTIKNTAPSGAKTARLGVSSSRAPPASVPA